MLERRTADEVSTIPPSWLRCRDCPKRMSHRIARRSSSGQDEAEAEDARPLVDRRADRARPCGRCGDAARHRLRLRARCEPRVDRSCRPVFDRRRRVGAARRSLARCSSPLRTPDRGSRRSGNGIGGCYVTLYAASRGYHLLGSEVVWAAVVGVAAARRLRSRSPGRRVACDSRPGCRRDRTARRRGSPHALWSRRVRVAAAAR